MFKFTVLCLMAVLGLASARPGLLPALGLGAYSAGSPYVAAPYAAPYAAQYAAPYAAPYAAAQIGYSAPFVAPYASSYNAHQIDHSVAYPSYQYGLAPAAYAAPGYV